MTFTDAYERTIDAKGRLQIPSQVRDVMEAAKQSRVLYLVPGSRPGTLSLFPQDQFEAMAQNMDVEPIPDKDALTFQQLFYSMASRLEMDKQGRVILPERTLQRAGIENQVMLTGVGNHLDLWNKEVYAKFMENNWGQWVEVQQQARAASRKNQIDNS